MPPTAQHASDPTQGFRDTYREHYGFVWHALHRFGVGRDALEDAAQETFLVAYRRQATRSGSAMKPWLYGIARRVASNHRRRDLRRTRKAAAFGELQSAQVETTHAFERVHALDRYLQTLGPRDRELFVLSELEGMTGPEIAASVGLNLNTIYSRVRKLRSDFEGDAGPGAVPAGVLEDAKQHRPSANARGWALLLPMLGRSPTVFAKIGSVLAGSKLLSVAAGASLAAGAVAITDVALSRRPELHDAMPVVASVSGPERGRTARPTVRPSSTVPAAPRPSPPVTQAPASLSPPPPSAPKVVRAEVASTAASSLDDLAQQNEQLERASRLLQAGDATAALEILTRQQREFPSSPIADLRAALRVEALCAAGEVSRARTAAAQALSKHTTSPVARRIRNSCIGSPQDPARPDTPGA